MELVDIRREYTVILSRLQLTADFPELMRSSAFSSCLPFRSFSLNMIAGTNRCQSGFRISRGALVTDRRV